MCRRPLAVAAYFVAHALYKAGLFLVAGIIDHGTGTRDVTALGGLRDHLTISFICSALAAVSMFGLPPFLGWFAKEEVYAALGTDDAAGDRRSRRDVRSATRCSAPRH